MKVNERSMQYPGNFRVSCIIVYMAIAIRLPQELGHQLTLLAKKTKRSKSFVARGAIENYLADISDYYVGMDVLKSRPYLFTRRSKEGM